MMEDIVEVSLIKDNRSILTREYDLRIKEDLVIGLENFQKELISYHLDPNYEFNKFIFLSIRDLEKIISNFKNIKV